LFGGKAIAETPPPNSVIVSKSFGGQFSTITDAIAAVKPHMKIIVRPGVYEEKITIDRPVEIVGDANGTGKEVAIETIGESCLVVETVATVRGFTLRSRPGIAGGLLKFFKQRNLNGEPCIDVSRGELQLEDCEVTSDAVAGAGVRGSDNKLNVRRCKIHSGNSNGVWFLDHAEG
jgi:hypothetical protein